MRPSSRARPGRRPPWATRSRAAFRLLRRRRRRPRRLRRARQRPLGAVPRVGGRQDPRRVLALRLRRRRRRLVGGDDAVPRIGLPRAVRGARARCGSRRARGPGSNGRPDGAQCFAEADVDRDGRITLEEFSAWYAGSAGGGGHSKFAGARPRRTFEISGARVGLGARARARRVGAVAAPVGALVDRLGRERARRPRAPRRLLRARGGAGSSDSAAARPCCSGSLTPWTPPVETPQAVGGPPASRPRPRRGPVGALPGRPRRQGPRRVRALRLERRRRRLAGGDGALPRFGLPRHLRRGSADRGEDGRRRRRGPRGGDGGPRVRVRRPRRGRSAPSKSSVGGTRRARRAADRGAAPRRRSRGRRRAGRGRAHPGRRPPHHQPGRPLRR